MAYTSERLRPEELRRPFAGEIPDILLNHA
jgi:hypothetical protein